MQHDANRSSPVVWVVVVNYRTPELTLDCLTALANEITSEPVHKVWVVDNASADGSVAAIGNAIAQQGWHWAELLPLPRNGGFAYGNNAVIRKVLAANSPPNYLLLLNPDTVVRPQAIASLVAFLEAHPEVGLAGSRLEEPDGTPQYSAFRYPSLWSELDNGLRLGVVSQFLKEQLIALPIAEEPCGADWLAGASLMIRRQVFASIGGFDEGYFLYFEEVDFCRRAQQAGWPCWYVPESRVVHLVGQSSGVTDTKRPAQRRPPYWFESRQRYFTQHHGWLYTALADAAWMVGFAFWRLRRRLQGRPDTDPPHFLQDFWRHSLWSRGTVP